MPRSTEPSPRQHDFEPSTLGVKLRWVLYDHDDVPAAKEPFSKPVRRIAGG